MKPFNPIRQEILIIGIVLAPFVYMLLVWDQIPAQLPIRWNTAGEVDATAPWFFWPLVNMGFYFLLLIIPQIDPRKKNYEFFHTTYYKLRLILGLFFSTILALIITSSLGFAINLNRLVLIGVILLLITLGNYMTTLRPNWFIGIRVPWTLESDTVWRKTHQLGGKLWFWMGLVLLILSFFLSNEWLSKLIVGFAIVMAIIPIVYAYVLYQREKQTEGD